MSISESTQKIKGFLKSERGRGIYISFIIILTAIGSFGLGRLSKIEEQKEPVVLKGNFTKEDTALLINSNTPEHFTSNTLDSGSSKDEDEPLKAYVASKRGKKYYLPWCDGAKQILEENKIWFSSEVEAEKAGYTKSSACPGL